MPQAHDATAERDRGERIAPVGVRGRSTGPWRWVLSALAGGIAGAVAVVSSGARLDAFATAAAILFACLIEVAAYAAVDSHRRSAERRREVRRLEAEVDDLLARGERLDSVGEDRAARDRDGRDLAAFHEVEAGRDQSARVRRGAGSGVAGGPAKSRRDRYWSVNRRVAPERVGEIARSRNTSLARSYSTPELVKLSDDLSTIEGSSKACTVS